MKSDRSETDEKNHKLSRTPIQATHSSGTLEESTLRKDSNTTPEINDQSRDETQSQIKLHGNSGWQSGRDLEDRRSVVSRILKILRSRKPRASQETLKKLSRVAQRLEISMYQSAPCLEAYNDHGMIKEIVNTFIRNNIDRSERKIILSRQKRKREPAPDSREKGNHSDQQEHQHKHPSEKHQQPEHHHHYMTHNYPQKQHHLQHQNNYPNQHPHHHNVQHQVQKKHHIYKCIAHRGLNGGWQSENDVNDRQMMINKIIDLMRQNKADVLGQSISKLSQMAKRLEEALYRSALSAEDYNSSNTIKARLQQLANNILMSKTKGGQAAVGNDSDSAGNAYG